MQFAKNILIPALILTVPLAAAPSFAQEPEVRAYAAPNGAPMSFAALIDDVSPAVVSIEARTPPQEDDTPDWSELPPQLRQYLERFGMGPPPSSRERRAQGSGFFISADGYVVTNNHVIEGAEAITIALSDGRDLQATIVGTDPATDLALLRVEDGGPFDFVELDRELDARVGDWVVAVGNPFGLGGTATAGIISATGRQIGAQQAYTDFLQIDAPINRGNSGGPTFDLDGNVVGVNSAIISPTGGSVGIGFAIPSDLAAQVIDQLIENGEVRRGFLGVAPGDLTADLKAAMGINAEVEGVLINQVIEGTPAQVAGLENGDIVLSVNGREVDEARELTRRVGAFAPGEDVQLRILRDEREQTITVTLAERPGAGEPVAPEPSVEPGQDRMFGMVLETPSDEDRERLELGEHGLLVASVEPGSEAAEKGLRPGDAILEAGQSDIVEIEDFREAAEAAQAQGRPALLGFVEGQGGQRRYAALDLSALE